jgi:hypothetical protein
MLTDCQLGDRPGPVFAVSRRRPLEPRLQKPQQQIVTAGERRHQQMERSRL